MEEASIAASQVALSEFTGRPVMGVFQTLLAGNAGQLVPGMIVPAARPDPDAMLGFTSKGASAMAAAAHQNRFRERVLIDASHRRRVSVAFTSGAYHRSLLRPCRRSRTTMVE